MKDMDHQIQIFQSQFDDLDIKKYHQQQEELWRLVRELNENNTIEIEQKEQQEPKTPINSTNQQLRRPEIEQPKQKKSSNQKEERRFSTNVDPHLDQDLTSASTITSLLMKQKVSEEFPPSLLSPFPFP